MSQTGWDKIFYFVGADTFSQKFRPKQRESDATTRQKTLKKAVIWVFPRQDISSSNKKFLTVA